MLFSQLRAINRLLAFLLTYASKETKNSFCGYASQAARRPVKAETKKNDYRRFLFVSFRFSLPRTLSPSKLNAA